MPAQFRLCTQGQVFEAKKEDVAAAELMNTKLKRRTPSKVCKEVMEWHLKETGKLMEHQKLGDSTHKCQHHNVLMKGLLSCCNL